MTNWCIGHFGDVCSGPWVLCKAAPHTMQMPGRPDRRVRQVSGRGGVAQKVLHPAQISGVQVARVPALWRSAWLDMPGRFRPAARRYPSVCTRIWRQLAAGPGVRSSA